eukprot:86731-Hanusia_phi.AAC.1
MPGSLSERSRNTQASFDPETLHFDDKSIMSADRSFDPENILYSASGRVEGYRASAGRKVQVLGSRISFASSKSYDPEVDFGSRDSKNLSFDPERFSFASENSFDPERSTWEGRNVQGVPSQISLDPEMDAEYGEEEEGEEEGDLGGKNASGRAGENPYPVQARVQGTTEEEGSGGGGGSRADGRRGQDISHLSALLRSALQGMRSADPLDDGAGEERGAGACKEEPSRHSVASFDPEGQADRSKICSTVLSFDPERELSLLRGRMSPMPQADGVGAPLSRGGDEGVRDSGGSNVHKDRPFSSSYASASVCIKVGQESGRFVVRSSWGDAQDVVTIGDELIKVDGFLLLGKSLEEVERLLEGERETGVEVELQSCMGHTRRVWLQRVDQQLAEVSRQFSVPTVGSPPSGVYGRIDASAVIQQLEVKYKSALMDAIQQRAASKQLEERVLELEGRLQEEERKRLERRGGREGSRG